MNTVAPAVTAASREYAAAVRRRLGPHVVAITLFGSYARGEAHEESDVDVAVVVDRLDSALYRDLLNMAADIGIAHELDVAPMVFDAETDDRWRRYERQLVIDIEREGIAL